MTNSKFDLKNESTTIKKQPLKAAFLLFLVFHT